MAAAVGVAALTLPGVMLRVTGLRVTGLMLPGLRSSSILRIIVVAVVCIALNPVKRCTVRITAIGRTLRVPLIRFIVHGHHTRRSKPDAQAHQQ